MVDDKARSPGGRTRLRSAFSWVPGPDRVARSLRRATRRIPFMDDVLSMYYCAVDPATPSKVKFVIGATLLYLVMPLDFIPDFLALVGYGDDITALMVLVRLVSAHVTDDHRRKAAEKLAAMADTSPGTATDAPAAAA